MGLFTRAKKQKQKAKPRPSQKQPQQPQDVAEQVFDDKYRAELRQIGRKHFKSLLEKSSADLSGDIDAILEQLTGSLRRHMASQLDLAITRVNNDISNQLKEKMNEYNRVSSEAQELVVQSLSRNAQLVHEKYQQMSTNLNQIVANQETMMVGVFQENESKVSSMQSEHGRTIEQLQSGLESARHQIEELAASIRASSDEQQRKLEEMYRENIDVASEMKRSQEAAIESLKKSVETIEHQQGKIETLVSDSIAKQRSLAAEVINEDMARIVEHYVIGALGERSDVAKDLPNILERLEENKQPMMEDMKL